MQYSGKGKAEIEFSVFVVVGQFDLKLLGEVEVEALENEDLSHLGLLVVIILPNIHYYYIIGPLLCTQSSFRMQRGSDCRKEGKVRYCEG